MCPTMFQERGAGKSSDGIRDVTAAQKAKADMISETMSYCRTRTDKTPQEKGGPGALIGRVPEPPSENKRKTLAVTDCLQCLGPGGVP